MKPIHAERIWARWGLLASAIALGGVLLFASWSNYRGARAATTTLQVGQARVFEREIMSVLRQGWNRGSEPGPAAALDSLLAAKAQEGLRYIALLDEEDRIVLSAGEPSPGSAEASPSQGDDSPGFRLSRVGERVRMSMTRPRFGPGAPPRAMPPAPPEQREGPEPKGVHHRGGILFEFEPVVASHLIERAGRLLAFGAAAAALMMLVAAFSHVMSLRYERAKRRLESERRLSLLGEMSAVMAHEIRNPLASLKGHAQLLAERLPAESSDRRKADRVVLEATRLEALTADLLGFVRIGPLDLRPADPAALLRASVEEVGAEGFALDAAAVPGAWRLDATRLRQALVNLLRNARQATPAEAEAPQASVVAAGERLIFTIRDFGAGLPPGQEERIFDPFFTTRASGTGLGLSVARRVVELHGGRLTAENHPEGGAVFRIVLPAEKD